jgi:hypothetical protein
MSELELFEILRKNLLPDLKKSDKQFSRFDCESESAKLHIELKCRRTHYDDLLIEKKKFDAIVERADEIGFAPCYINSTPQGIYAFNLHKVQVTWENHPMPATTDFGNAQLVEKAVGFLPIAQAVHLPGAVDL